MIWLPWHQELRMPSRGERQGFDRPTRFRMRRAPDRDTGCFAAGVLSFARWDGHRGLFRGAGIFHSFRDCERAVSGEFHRADAGSERAAGAAAEDSDSWPGSGDASGTFGFDGNFCREYETSSSAGAAGACCIDTRQGAHQGGATRAQAVEFWNTEVLTAGGRMRVDGRNPDQMRPLQITPDFISPAEGIVLIELGDTREVCTATVNDAVPSFVKG